MPAFRSVVSVLLRSLGDSSLHPQGRPCGRPEAARRPGDDTAVTGGTGLTLHLGRHEPSPPDKPFAPQRPPAPGGFP